MFRSFILLCSLGGCSLDAFAQAGSAFAAPMQSDPAQQATSAPQLHERRLALRAALAAQREEAGSSQGRWTGERQLSDRERAELRQQLRQQRSQ